jgi:hypothetical protein
MATPIFSSLKLLTWFGIASSAIGYFDRVPTVLATTTTTRSPLFLGSGSAVSRDRSRQLTIAGANNFNPALTLPLQRSIPAPAKLPTVELVSTPAPAKLPTVELVSTPTTPTVDPSTTKPAESVATTKPFAVLEGLQPDIRSDWNNSGQVNQTIEQTAIFRLGNGDRATVKTGYDTYIQPDTKTVTNIPVQVGWETKIDSVKVQPTVGVDFLAVSTTPNFGLKIDYPLTTGLTVSTDIQQGAYKFNAKTIDNQISALRYGPSLFWTIDPDTTLFSSLRLGNYSDGNAETQSFTRLERKFGEFSLAANLFTWGYKNPTDKGYFAPSDFIVYTGEIAWEGDVIANALKCRVAVPLGEQKVNGITSDAGGYQTKCTVKISPNFEADVGYVFSNVKNQSTGLSTGNSQSLGTQVRIKF